MGLNILFLLIPASLVLACVALLLFIWAIRSGQFDDLETPAIRMLFDDAPTPGDAPARTNSAALAAAASPVKRTE